MENPNKQNLADALVEILSSSRAWVHIADDNRPMIYLNIGDDVSLIVKKVQVFDEAEKKMTTKWVNLGVASKKEVATEADAAVVQAVKELIAEGKMPSKQ